MTLIGKARRLVIQLQIALIVMAYNAAATDVSSRSRPKDVQRELSDDYYFNMKLHWQKGYRWQGSSSERKWCMQCRSNRCSKGSSIKIMRCNKDDWKQHFFFDDGKIRSRRNKDVCLERQGRSISLSNCSSRRQGQIWARLTKDEPFQLKIPGVADKCVSQHHHPKHNEKVYMTSCKRSVYSKTDKWITY